MSNTKNDLDIFYLYINKYILNKHPKLQFNYNCNITTKFLTIILD